MSWPRRVLAGIRSAIGDAPVPPVTRGYRTTDDRPAEVLLDLLVDRLEDYRATVLRCGPDDVATTVATALAAVPGDVVVAPGVPAGLAAGRRNRGRRPPRRGPRRLRRDPDRCRRGGRRDRHPGSRRLAADGPARRLSLLPDCLVCVVEAAQVVGTVPEGLAVLDPLAPLTMISGPSATSDIELQRVEGVHGPRTLIVVLVE